MQGRHFGASDRLRESCLVVLSTWELWDGEEQCTQDIR